MLFDFFPIVLFFAAFKLKGIYFATSIAIAATIVQIALTYLIKKKVDTMLWISLLVIAVFGGMTLALHNELFIKWKPTILYWIFSSIIFTGRLLFKKNVIALLLKSQISIPDTVCEKLNLSWGGFFAFLGGLNLYVAYSYSTSAWVNFKLFGILGLLVAFVIAQSIFLAKYIDPQKTN